MNVMASKRSGRGGKDPKPVTVIELLTYIDLVFQPSDIINICICTRIEVHTKN